MPKAKRNALQRARAHVRKQRKDERAEGGGGGENNHGAAGEWQCWGVALSSATVVILTHLAITSFGIRFDLHSDLSRWWYRDGVAEFRRGLEYYHAASTGGDVLDDYGGGIGAGLGPAASPSATALGGLARQHSAASRNDRMAHELFSDAAELGNPDAQHYLGTMHERGEGGLAPSTTEAARWFRKAAARGHVRSQFKVGAFFYYGIGGLRQDKARGIVYWRRAALGGNKEAQFNMGVVFDSGDGIARNVSQAVRFWRMAADQGDTAAQSNVGSAYHTGQGVPQSDDEAIRWWSMAARGGRAEAALSIGVSYKNGAGGLPPDPAAAFRWLAIAADHLGTPLAAAQFHVAMAYRNGDGVMPSRKKAVQYLTRAAHAKHMLAQFRLGMHYAALLLHGGASGGDAASQLRQAQHWYGEAAAQGHAESMHNLAILLDRDLDHDLDAEQREWNRDEAMSWWETAAELDFAPAQHELSLRSASGGFGRGYERANVSAAVEWSDRAVKQNYSPAQFIRGSWHRDGAVGLERGEDLAAQYWRLAAAQNHAEAQRSLGLMLMRRGTNRVAIEMQEGDSAESSSTMKKDDVTMREAVDYLRSAALLGDHTAMGHFGAALMRGVRRRRFPLSRPISSCVHYCALTPHRSPSLHVADWSCC